MRRKAEQSQPGQQGSDQVRRARYYVCFCYGCYHLLVKMFLNIATPRKSYFHLKQSHFCHWACVP